MNDVIEPASVESSKKRQYRQLKLKKDLPLGGLRSVAIVSGYREIIHSETTS